VQKKEEQIENFIARDFIEKRLNFEMNEKIDDLSLMSVYWQIFFIFFVFFFLDPCSNFYSKNHNHFQDLVNENLKYRYLFEIDFEENKEIDNFLLH
jgi:hypothetical protein